MMQNPAPSPAETPPLIVALRLATAPIHEAVEALPGMRRLMGPAVTLADYRRFLSRLAGLYGSLEASLYAALEAPGAGLPAARIAALGLRPKFPALAADLAANALPPPHLDRAEPGPSDLNTALGGLYILEGSSLGGRVIARHLRKHLENPLPGENFFEFHGDRAGADWKAFGQALEDLAAQGAIDPAAVIAGACATFRRIYNTLATLDREDIEA